MIVGMNVRAGAVWSSSQLVTVLTLAPSRAATSFCRNPKSMRRFRRWSPMVRGSLG